MMRYGVVMYYVSHGYVAGSILITVCLTLAVYSYIATIPL